MLNQVTATIVTIGDEILIGQITDTNSQWIASNLDQIGVTVLKMLSISDDADEIKTTLKQNKSDLLIFTGGLGPTKDDITKHTLSDYFSSPLVVDQQLFEKLSNYYFARNRPFNDLNQTQALVPKDCVVLDNDFGTAAGMWFENKNQIVISLPGVPLEMQKLMELQVLPKVRKHFSTSFIYHKTLHTIAITESDLAIKISDWQSNLPQEIKLAYLPSLGIVRLRLSLKTENKITAEKIVQPYLLSLKRLVSENIFGEDGVSIEEVIGQLLLQKKKTLATAESCTGGNIGHLLTSVSGSSAYYNGGVITYSNDVKINLLNVPKVIIDKYGAVSEETVISMAENVRGLLQSDYGISVSGIAGPGGGTDEKPVGTVWVAFSSKEKVIAKKLLLTPHRENNIRLSSVYALDLLRTHLLNS